MGRRGSIRFWARVAAGLSSFLSAGGTAEATSAPARPSVVVVVQNRARATGATDEIALRIAAELAASGVAVVMLPCRAGEGGCGRGPLPEPAAKIVVEPGRVTIDTSSDREGLRGGAEPVSFPTSEGGSPRGPGALAVRAVEVVRAMLVDRPEQLVPETPEPAPAVGADMDPAEPAAAPLPARIGAQRAAPPPRAPPEVSHFEASLGVALVNTLSGLGPGIGPSARLGWRPDERWVLSLLLTGPVWGGKHTGIAGATSVQQEYGLLELAATTALGKRLVPRAGLGLGVHHLYVQGRTTGTVTARDDEKFSAMLAAKVGLLARATSILGAFVDAHAFILAPNPVVREAGLPLARGKSPAFLLSSGIELRF